MTLVRQLLTFFASLGLASAPISAIPNTPEPKIVSDARTAAEWVATALSSSGYKADFSMQSLAELGRFFDDNAPNGVARPDGLLAENLGSRSFAIGSYVGETLRRNQGGEWIGDDSDPQAEVNLALKLSDGSLVWPVQRAMKRFRNVGEDGLAAYGAAIVGLR